MDPRPSIGLVVVDSSMWPGIIASACSSSSPLRSDLSPETRRNEYKGTCTAGAGIESDRRGLSMREWLGWVDVATRTPDGKCHCPKTRRPQREVGEVEYSLVHVCDDGCVEQSSRVSGRLIWSCFALCCDSTASGSDRRLALELET
jgi:hypothetical protein